MNLSESRFANLLNSYHTKTATKAELRELFYLLNEKEDQELTHLLEQEWKNEAIDTVFDEAKSTQLFNTVLDKYKQKQSGSAAGGRRRMLLRKLSVAAAFIIVAIIGVYLAMRPTVKDMEQHISHQQVAKDAFPGGDIATLNLGDGKTVILKEIENGTVAVQGNCRITKTQDGLLIYEPLGSAASKQTAADNILSTPRGGQFQVVLSDGSKVWLNAASSLKYPANFEGTERIVELNGEAYFEVAKNKSIPFKVRSGSVDVEVLGTHFNVMAYADEGSQKVTLLEGAVKIRSEWSDQVLRPGQQAVLNNQTGAKVLNNVKAADAIAWKNGLFQFDNADIPTIMRAIARWYDLEISYNGAVPAKRFTGKISRDIKASELLTLLRYSGINLEIKEKKIVIIN